jgi:hypothetical protein
VLRTMSKPTYEGCGDENLSGVFAELEVEREGIGDGASKSGEPHDHHHLLRDLGGTPSVAEHYKIKCYSKLKFMQEC